MIKLENIERSIILNYEVIFIIHISVLLIENIIKILI